jgi:CelD/BcsL family acetyltransferase involved in cellulose biosynthesis
MAKVSVRVFRGLDEFLTLRDIWDVLLERSASSNVFLSWKWISTWCRVYLEHRQVFALAVYVDDEPVAIAPWWSDTRRIAGLVPLRTIRFMGSGDVCSDYLDIIVRKDLDADGLRPLWQELFGPLRSEWDVIEYSDTLAGSAPLSYFYHWAGEDDRCLSRRIDRITICPYLALPPAVDEFRAGLSGTRRYALNRTRRYFEDTGPVEFRYSRSPEDVVDALSRLRALNTRSWQERGQPGSFATERFVRFHNEVAQSLLQAGRLVLCSLWVGQNYLGGFYGFQHDDVLYFYIMSVERSDENRVNAGDLLLAEVMEEAIRRGCREFDFLRGDESYKYRWTGTDRRTSTLILHNKSWGAALDSVFSSAREATRSVVKVLARSISGTSPHATPSPRS